MFPGYPSEVVDGSIYIGSKSDAGNREQLRNLGVTHVLNASHEMPNFHETDISLRYLKLELLDNDDQDMGPAFEAAFAFLDDALGASASSSNSDNNTNSSSSSSSNGGRVLVHCQMGVSRSASLVIAYAMRAYQCSLLHAIAMVRARRQQVLPNKGFLVQLARLEHRLRPEEPGTLRDCLEVLYPRLPVEDTEALVAKV
jgi:atypical dual specificity phosphatase